VYSELKGNQSTKVTYASMLKYWIDMMCDDWIICSCVTILVEMKLEYWGLKANQGTMVKYASICFSSELIWCVMTKLYVHM